MTKMHEPALYEIRIQGHLENRWAKWFEGLTIRLTEHGETLITGWVDQAALYGALRKFRDLGLPLLSVMPVEPDQADLSEASASQTRKKTMNTTNELITTTLSKTSVPPRKRRGAFTRADWLVPTGLILLTMIPSLAGVLRLIGLAEGTSITSNDAYFYVMPLPVVLHILGALPFCILGAFQFAPGFRRRWPRWHRLAGRLLVLCGLTAGLSGLWMTQFYPLLQTDLLYSFRMLFGSAMVLSLALGLVAILRRDITRHRACMLRGYAIGQGAGTQALTALIWVLIFGPQSELTRELLMGASWVINLVVVEWIIRRKRSMGRQKQKPMVSSLGRPQYEQQAF